MAHRQRKAWGFPRWGDYGQASEATTVRLCDRAGCTERGEHRAPKSPNSNEYWWFCQAHAAEYNRNWNYFEGLSAEEARARAREEARTASGYARSSTWEWMSPGATTLKEEALTALELPMSATADDIKTQYRRLVKRYHPDINEGDPQAAKRFHEVQQAYEVLTSPNT
ncbi:MAG: J domain-containing protein [Pseudomonadota bacterium]